ncbi:MAG: hypothetical protein WDN66_05235 [Candidatus Saccharibacteria bacterium]
MGRTINLPEASPEFEVDPSELSDIYRLNYGRERTFVEFDKFEEFRGIPNGMLLYDAMFPILQRARKALHATKVGGVLDCRPAYSGRPQRAVSWHIDNFLKGIVVSDVLPTVFAEGAVPRSSDMGKAYEHRIATDDPSEQQKVEFAELVGTAIDKGMLREVSTDPYVGYIASGNAIHSPAINETDENMDRCFMVIYSYGQ